MKKKYLLWALIVIFSVAVICLLASCDFSGNPDGRKKINKPISSYSVRYLHFVDTDGNTVLDYQINRSYSDSKLRDVLYNETVVDYYVPSGGHYLDGTEFNPDYDALNDYIVYHNADTTFEGKALLGNNPKYPAFTVVVEMVPKEYTIVFSGVDGATFDGPATYNVTMSGQPLPTASKPFYHFLGWYELKEGEPNVHYVKEQYPYVCENVTYYASWQAISFDIVYEDDGVPNTNKKIIYQKDGVYSLIPIENNEYWTFHGWKLNGEYVTTLDPMELWDATAPAWDREKYTVTLTADLEYFRHDFDYYVDGELFQHYNFDYREWQVFKAPAVPAKEHYTGSWSTNPTEFKDSRFDAVYEIDKYEVAVQTNVGGYTLEKQKYEYGTTYAAIYEQLSYPNKQLIGLYLDRDCTQRAKADDLILQSGTLYAKFSDKYEIRSFEDWSLLQEHNDAYFELENDINFLGNEIPIVTEFKGILDGQGFKVTNFINLNPTAPNTYGLFLTNSGTIKNITFSSGVYTVTTIASPNLNTSNRVGLVAAINKGTFSNVTLDDISVKITCTESTEKWGTNLSNISTAPYAGVLCGVNEGEIEYCTITDSVNASINTKMYVIRDVHYSATIKTWASYGLFAGGNKGSIRHVTADGRLNSTAERREVRSTYGGHYEYVHYILRVGGVVGANLATGVISDSLSNANVNADFISAKSDVDGVIVVHNNFYGIVDIGGVVGVNAGQIERCVASKDALLHSYAEAETRIGGLVGTNDNGSTLRASYTKAQLAIGNRSATERTYCGGVVGLNSGAITHCYAIVDSLQLLTFENTFVNLGGLFGYSNDTGTIVNSFAKIDVEGLYSNNVCGFYDKATVVKCYVYLTKAATGFESCNDVTVCDTEGDLFAAITPMGYDVMGFTLSDGEYPTLPNAGNTVK